MGAENHSWLNTTARNTAHHALLNDTLSIRTSTSHDGLFKEGSIGKRRSNYLRRGYEAEVCVDYKRKSRTFDSAAAADAWASLQEGKVTVPGNLQLPMSGLHLTPEEIIGNAYPYHRIQGIYFLTLGAEIVYVGKSSNLMNRISQHSTRGMVFDGYYFIICAESRAEVLEQYYIKKFNPRNNTTHSTREGTVVQIMNA